MGPGPANAHPRVLAAQTLPLLGECVAIPTSELFGLTPVSTAWKWKSTHHLQALILACPSTGHMHPPFFKIMDEIQAGLRYLFQTNSKYTLLISGTGHAGASRGFPLRPVVQAVHCAVLGVDHHADATHRYGGDHCQSGGAWGDSGGWQQGHLGRTGGGHGGQVWRCALLIQLCLCLIAVAEAVLALLYPP